MAPGLSTGSSARLPPPNCCEIAAGLPPDCREIQKDKKAKETKNIIFVGERARKGAEIFMSPLALGAGS